MSDRPVCDSCGRPLPHEPSDAPVRKRSIVAISEPKGEEGTLIDLMEQVATGYREAGLLPPGEPTWKYGVVHFALLSVAQARGDVRLALMPSETGA